MSKTGCVGSFLNNLRTINGFLLDIYGVLYDEGKNGPEAITGSVDAIKKLNEAQVPYRLCSNTSTQTKEDLCQTLTSLGFDVKPHQIYCPAPIARQLLERKGLRPYLLVAKAVLPDFAGLDQTNPNCVVLGDATHGFSYDRLNEAFRILISNEAASLITLGAGKYYREQGQLQLDVGAYAKALEYATDITPVCVGKPDAAYFKEAVDDMGLLNDEVAMIGDDIVSDVGGAQKCMLKAIQVRTGKYRPSDEPHPEVKPDGYVDNLLQAVNVFLEDWVTRPT